MLGPFKSGRIGAVLLTHTALHLPNRSVFVALHPGAEFLFYQAKVIALRGGKRRRQGTRL